MKKVYIVCIAVACLLIAQVFRLFYSIPDRDVLLGSSFSPSGDYIVYFYRNDGKGATVRSSIIADVYSERTGKTRNIFYRYGESEVDSGWHDDKNITINGCMSDAENGEYISKRHSDYRSLDPVRTVYSQDERYCIYIYEVYVGFGNSKSSRYFIDAVDRMT